MPNARALLLDTDGRLLRLVAATLRLQGIEPTQAGSSADALRAMRLLAPDLVISEFAMSDLAGFDLLRRARSLPGLASLPFVFMTKTDPTEPRKAGLRLGEVSFLRKPFAIEELLRVCRDALAHHTPSQPGGESAVSGSLATIQVAEVLRQMHGEHRSGRLTVKPRGVHAQGWVHLRDGLAIHAEFGLLVGVDALFALLPYQEGTWRLEPELVQVPPLIVEALLPLLAEGQRLVKAGILPRIDPGEVPAVRMFTRLVAEKRQPTPLASRKATSLLSAAQASEELADTDDFEPGFLSSELEDIEAEARTNSAVRGTILVKPTPDFDSSETAVALVNDTLAEFAAPAPPPDFLLDASDAMDIYETLLGISRNELGASSVQLGTVSGRVIASNIADPDLRESLAEFSEEAIQFAVEEPGKPKFASLDAAKLHVLVFEVDDLRLLTLLFSRKPNAEQALKILSPVLELVRIAR